MLPCVELQEERSLEKSSIALQEMGQSSEEVASVEPAEEPTEEEPPSPGMPEEVIECGMSE